MQRELTEKHSYLDRIAGVVLCTGTGGMTGLIVVLGIVSNGPTLAAGFAIWGVLAATGAVVGWKLIPKYAAPGWKLRP